MKHIGRIKVVEEAEDIMECICICPHCGRKARYGEMHMYCGEHGCPECADDLYDSIEFDLPYSASVRRRYEFHRCAVLRLRGI